MHKHSSLALNEPARKQAVASLRSYSADRFDEELSELQATLLLDHLLADIGPAIYDGNRGSSCQDLRRYPP